MAGEAPPSRHRGRIELPHPRGVTDLRVGVGVLSEPAGLAHWWRDRRVFVLTSPPVWGLHGAELRTALAAAAQLEVLPVPDGEQAKTLEVAAGLWREMLRRGGKRDSRVVTFGGGTVGDLGGFVAGCFLRGVPYGQVPTTLLAQVDAAIGGKTAVDLPEGKNTVGLFHHPDWVLIDTRWLASLPAPELRSGLFEVIKMGFLLDPSLFERVERSLDELLAGDPAAWAPVVEASVRAKAAVVERDPEEAGLRRLLNFGHTLGHAIEAVTDYRAMRHGEAVGWGLLFALELSRARGLAASEADRLAVLIRRVGLPALEGLAVEDLVAAMGRDKKTRESGLAWVLARRLGEGVIDDTVSWDEVRGGLDRLLAEA